MTELSPNYEAAAEIARRFIEHFEDEHFKPLVGDFTKAFTDKLWEDISAWLLGDTESNLQLAIYDGIERSVKALLGGERWALDRYALGERYDCEKIRAAVAEHIPVELQDARIADLEAENKRLKEDLQWHRDR